MDTDVDQDRLRLQALVEINQLLMGALEPDDLLQVILESTIRLFSSERCSLALIDEAKQQHPDLHTIGGRDVASFVTGDRPHSEARGELRENNLLCQDIKGCSSRNFTG